MIKIFHTGVLIKNVNFNESSNIMLLEHVMHVWNIIAWNSASSSLQLTTYLIQLIRLQFDFMT